MDGTLIAALGALAVSSIGFVSTLITKKTRGPEDVATQRRDTIAERDSLIASFKEDIRVLKEDSKSHKEEIAELRTEVEAVRDHNNVLINYCYRLIAALRRHGHDDEIPSPPPNGIHI